jgi:hypothetical protein
MVNKTCKPQLQWLDTEELEPSYVNPMLDQVRHVPGQIGYIGRRLQNVRGHILRGRPKFLNSLNICSLDDYVTNELPVNDTLHHGPSAVCNDRSP